MNSVLMNPARSSPVRDIISLTKPRIVVMTVVTAGWGVALAPSYPGHARVLAALVGTALCVGSANTLNQVLERDVDGLMERTRNRPLPAKRLTARTALIAGLVFGVVSLVLLGVAVNALTALLGAIALFIYVLMYTPLKRHTAWALLVGAVAGAMPPLMGWTAATGQLGLPGILLMATLLVWQIPHFIAISIFRADDYARAGLCTVPQQAGEPIARVYMLATSLGLLAVSLILPLVGKVGWGYGIAALAAGGWLSAAGFSGLRKAADDSWARRYFAVTLIYLPAVLLGTLVDIVVG